MGRVNLDLDALTPSNLKLDQFMSSCTPKIAICLAAYNGKDWLAEQLDSIFAQEGVEVNIIVSVDQSADGTEEWFNARAKVESRITLLPHGYNFGCAARNFFRILRDADLSSFDYVGFSDQDDIWFPNKLLRSIHVLLDADADAYSSNVLAFWPDGTKILIKKSQSQAKWDFLFEAGGPGCTYLMRKTFACALQEVVRCRWGEVQNVGMHDWFAYAFARANNYKWVIDNAASMLYRQHESNEVGANAGYQAFRFRIKQVLSGWWLGQAALIARLIGLGNSPFVLRWASAGIFGDLYLALHARHCRRRLRDKFIFSFLCLILAINKIIRR